MTKILLIEDDKADQLIFERNIKKSEINCTIEIVDSIQSALAYLQEKAIDVVFCDFNLPDGDAIGFLKSSQEFPIPVVVITSHGDIEKATESLKLGAFDFVTKDNINTPSLERIINNVLRIKKENEKRQELELQLRRNYANTAAILANTNDGIWSIDKNGKILIVNKAIKKFTSTHYNYEPQVGDFFFSLLKNEEYDTLLNAYRSALKGESVVITVKTDIEGENYFFEISCSPIYEDNVITGVTFFSRNVSERIKAEKEILKAKKIAEEASEFKTRFLANMSHEIRTPMNAMIGFTELLQETKLNNEQMNYVEIIQKSGQNLLVIINDILDLSKLQSGKMELRLDKTDLRNLINDVVSLYVMRSKEQGIVLSSNIDENIPSLVMVDNTRLSQILNNVVSNAIKFTKEGGVSIGVRLLEQFNNKAKIEFSIQDQGIGIPQDKIDSIFEDFSQIDSSLQRKTHGTGLGLSIVSNLVKLMGGEIKVDSKLNVGTTIRITIPFEIPETSKLNGVQQQKEYQKSIRSGTRILLCDDVELNRLLVQKILSKFDIQLVSVSNGAEAIKALENEEFDVVLMDLQMPEMDGYQVTKIVRQFSQVPIIALTSHLLDDVRNTCLEIGMNGFISKPFKSVELINEIEKLTAKDRDVKLHPNQFWDELDMPTLHQLADGDLVFVDSLFTSFLSSLPGRVEEYKKAMHTRDSKILSDIAHLLQSSFKLFNLNELSSMSQEIQNDNVNDSLAEKFLSNLLEAEKLIIEKKKLVAKHLEQVKN